MIFLLVRLSCGSLYSVYFNSTLSISVLAYWYNLLLLENIINAISQSHSTDNSYAFFITPNLRLLKVTWKSIKYTGEKRRRKKKRNLMKLKWNKAKWISRHSINMWTYNSLAWPGQAEILLKINHIMHIVMVVMMMIVAIIIIIINIIVDWALKCNCIALGHWAIVICLVIEFQRSLLRQWRGQRQRKWRCHFNETEPKDDSG